MPRRNDLLVIVDEAGDAFCLDINNFARVTPIYFACSSTIRSSSKLSG